MMMNLKRFLLAAVFTICLFGGGSFLHAAPKKNEVQEFLLEYLKQNKIRGIRDVVPIDLARLMVSEYRGARIAVFGEYTGINTNLPQPVSAEYKENNFVFLSLAGKVPADKLLIAIPLKLNPKLPETLTSLKENQPILLVGKARTVRQKAKGKNKSSGSVADSRFFVFEVEQILPMPDDLPEPDPENGKAVKADPTEKPDAAEETEAGSEENGEEGEDAEEEETDSEETKPEEKPAPEPKKAQPAPAAETPPGSDEWE